MLIVGVVYEEGICWLWCGKCVKVVGFLFIVLKCKFGI